MKLGILSLVDYYPDCQTPSGRLQGLVEQAVLAESLGFDTFWVGEHHFSHYMMPNPAVVLAAIATRTRRIRVGTGVALAPHHHPLRLAEDYAVVDALSDGRLDLVLGRGFFLSGYQGFNQTFAESRPRLEDAAIITRGVWEQETFSYVGQTVQVKDINLQPRPVQARAPIWIGGGRGPDTVLWAAQNGFHLALPSVFGPLLGFEPLCVAYRETLAAAGYDPAAFQVSGGQHCYVGESHAAAHALWEPRYRRYVRFVGELLPQAQYCGSDLEVAAARIREAGDKLDFAKAARSSLLCGEPGEVAERIIEAGERMALAHFWIMVDLGGLPAAELRRSLERFAAQAMPRVRAALPEPAPQVEAVAAS